MAHLEPLVPQKRTVRPVVTTSAGEGPLEGDHLLYPPQAGNPPPSLAPRVPLDSSIGPWAGERGSCSSWARTYPHVAQGLLYEHQQHHSSANSVAKALPPLPGTGNLLQVQTCDKCGDTSLLQPLIQSLGTRCVQNSEFFVYVVHYMAPLWNLGLYLIISHIKIFLREHYYSKELKKVKTIINGCTSVQVWLRHRISKPFELSKELWRIWNCG